MSLELPARSKCSSSGPGGSSATRWPSERISTTDPQTGLEVVQWTRGPFKDQHLYFTSLSVTADDRWLVLISDRNGHPNLYAIDRHSGTMRQLSRNENGLLRSYVYPSAGVRGLNKVSPCLDAVRNRLYYVRDDSAYMVELGEADPIECLLCQLPPGWSAGFTHVSPDGRHFCVPCTDTRAFVDPVETQWDQMRQVPQRMKALSLKTRLYLIDTASGRMRVAAEVPFWVTHVQFDPAGTGRLIFNQEGFAYGTPDAVRDRIWCLTSDGTFRPLAPQRPDEWRSHENWSPDGQTIVYHGGHAGRSFVAARNWDGRLVHEADLADVQFHHATAALDGRRLFVDKRDGLIAVCDPSVVPAALTNLCRHDSSMKDQDTHAHPITTPSGASVIFTTDRSGTCDVCEVVLPQPIVS